MKKKVVEWKRGFEEDSKARTIVHGTATALWLYLCVTVKLTVSRDCTRYLNVKLLLWRDKKYSDDPPTLSLL